MKLSKTFSTSRRKISKEPDNSYAKSFFPLDKKRHMGGFIYHKVRIEPITAAFANCAKLVLNSIKCDSSKAQILNDF